VEVIRRFWHERVVPAWYGFVRVVGDLLDESTFRAVLAFNVIAGRVPLEVERRPWNRSLETPVLVEIRDWTDNRLVFTVLVWPPLESPPETAAYDHRERVRTVKEAIGKGAAEMVWSTRFETDYGLRWDHKRQVWTTQNGFAYDGKRTHDAA
jgi:hypothetical protein